MHKSSSKRDDFLIQAQHIIQPDLAKQPRYHANEGWKQEMIRLNATGARRGRNKRLLSEHQKDDSWTASISIQERSESIVMDDQERILEYLQVRHQGNVEYAELSLRVHLQSGTGTCRKYNRMTSSFITNILAITPNHDCFQLQKQDDVSAKCCITVGTSALPSSHHSRGDADGSEYSQTY